MAGLVGLASAIVAGPPRPLRRVECAAYDDEGRFAFPPWSLQFYPDSVSIQMSADYSEKAVIGGSHSLKSWANTSGRAISFALLVGRDMEYQEDLPEPARSLIETQSARNAQYNRDVRLEIDRWEAMMLPSYAGVSDAEILAKPPPVLQVTAPGMAWGLTRADPDTIWGVVTSVGVEYLRLFPGSGKPRLAKIDVSISETVQIPGQPIAFYGLQDILDRPWWQDE